MGDQDKNISFGPDFMSDEIPIFQNQRVDEDWKQKTQQESEKINTKLKEEKQQKQHNTTSPSFMRLISILGSQTYIFLGAIENPATGTHTVNLDQARDSIDSLTALVEKTQGNLSEEEDNLVKQVVSELQLLYVEATRHSGPSTDPNQSSAE